MAKIYIIGDVHGHYDALMRLLTQINYSDSDFLWFTGDLVNRGDKSIEVLRFVRDLKNKIVVLGNHDISLLVQAENFPKWGGSALADEILQTHDGIELLEMLRHFPLLHYEPNLQIALSHAGIYPQWTLEKALILAQEVEEALRQDNYREFLFHIYGDEPEIWCDDLKGFARKRFIINAFCRMRYVSKNGFLDMKKKDTPQKNYQNNEDLIPWFYQDLSYSGQQFFGHWAALGFNNYKNVYCLDDGYAWGGALIAWDVYEQKIAGKIKSIK